jgi:hypothetical protein
VYRVLVGKPKGKRPLGRPRCRWEDNIRMDLQEVGCGIQLSGFSAYLDGSPSHLIRISGVLLHTFRAGAMILRVVQKISCETWRSAEIRRRDLC